jgi:hypothetical protein
MVNQVVPGGDSGKSSAQGQDMSKLMSFYAKHNADGKAIDQEFLVLKQEAVKLGIVSA